MLSMAAYRFWGITCIYIGAGILLGALLFFAQQYHDGTLIAASPIAAPALSASAIPSASPTSTVLNQTP